MDADELAQRYLALWAQYLTALLGDPRTLDMVKRWVSVVGQFSYPKPSTADESAPFPAWPPVFGPFGPLPVAPAAGAPGEQPGEREDGLTELARRVEALERRVAALEHPQKPRAPRRRQG